MSRKNARAGPISDILTIQREKEQRLQQQRAEKYSCACRAHYLVQFISHHPPWPVPPIRSGGIQCSPLCIKRLRLSCRWPAQHQRRILWSLIRRRASAKDRFKLNFWSIDRSLQETWHAKQGRSWLLRMTDSLEDDKMKSLFGIRWWSTYTRTRTHSTNRFVPRRMCGT